MADNANGAQEGAQKNGGAALDVRDIAAERDRASQIADLCAAVGLGHRAGEMIESKASVTEVREKIRGEAEQSLKAMAPGAGVQLTDREVKRYSLTKAIMARAEQGENWSGLEREISDQIAKNLPSSYKMHGGIMVPTNLRPDAPRLSASNMYVNRMRAHIQSDPNMSLPNRMRMVQQLDQMQAALDATNATQGGNTVFTEAGEFLDLLRARMQVAALGATILTGLRGPVAFPKQSGAGTFSWVAEDPGSDLSDSDLAIAQVALNPKAGSSTTAYTRQLLTEASIDVDNLVKMDLAKITALGIDAAAIAGTGGSNSPTGILSTSGIGSVAIGTDGGVPTYSHVVDLETEVAIDNADIGSMAYLTTPGIRGRLKKTEEFALANGRPVWTGGMQGELNGYPAAVSTQVPSTLTKGASSGTCHAIIFGVWAELIVGYWGAFELVVDPYSKKKQGLIELTSFQMAGIAVKHAEAFAACKDAKTS